MKGKLPMEDGAEYGMAGVLVPVAGRALTKVKGELTQPPSTDVWIHGACGTCSKMGHRAWDCPAEIHVMNGQRRASMRYMFGQGHFNADGTKK